MSRLKKITSQKVQRTRRVRTAFTGTADRPRLSIFVSNRHITAQIIDDEKQKTLVYATTVGMKIPETETMTQRAQTVGGEIAKKAQTAKITKVVFDRGSRLYHGRVKALADAARAGGLEF